MSASRSPQLEDGHLRLANELCDAILSYPFTARQLKVVFAIARKTYGYNKKTDDVSASQIAQICSLQRTHVTSALNALAKLNVITKEPGVYGSIVGINKDYSAWINEEKTKIASTESVQVGSTETVLGCTESVHSTESVQGVPKALFASTESVQVGSTETVLGCTESVHSTESVQGVPKALFASTESVQVGSTETVHTKDNLPKDNIQKTCTEELSLSMPSEQRTPTPIAKLPLAGGSEYEVFAEQAREWSLAYPAVDVEAELIRMRVWLTANAKKRKTKRGIAAFIVTWLSRTQDKPRPDSPAHGSRYSSASNSAEDHFEGAI